MPRPDTAPTSPASVDAASTSLARSLRRLRLSPADTRSVLAEVRADLELAAADGVDPGILIGPDPDAFARDAAAARGLQPRPGGYGRTVLSGLIGAVAALVAGYLLITYVLFPFFTTHFDLDGHHPVLGPYVVMSAVALAGVLGVLGLLALHLQGRPAARATLARAALLVPAAAAVGVVVIGRAVMDVDTPTSSDGIITRAVLVVLLLAAALLAARIWATRSTRPAAVPHAPSPS